MMSTKKQFDESDFVCPFRMTKCVQDGCTHFERRKASFSWGDNSIQYNYRDVADCHAGQNVTLWCATSVCRLRTLEYSSSLLRMIFSHQKIIQPTDGEIAENFRRLEFEEIDDFEEKNVRDKT
jgi:hypothetical protein